MNINPVAGTIGPIDQDLVQDGGDRNLGTYPMPWTVGYFFDLFSTTINGWLNPKGVHPDGDGFKHQRVMVPTLDPSTTRLITVTWTRPFVDVKYTIAATPSVNLEVVVASLDETKVVLAVTNETRLPQGGAVHLIAIHD